MKIRTSRREGRSPNPLLLSSRWSIGRQGLQIPIICIVLGLAVLYLGERSVASIFSSDSQTGTSLEAVEAYAAAALRTVWSSATGQAQIASSANAPASTTQPAAAVVAAVTPEGSSELTAAAKTAVVPRSLITPASPSLSSGLSLTPGGVNGSGNRNSLPHTNGINDARWSGAGATDAWTDTGNWQGGNGFQPNAAPTVNTYYGDLPGGRRTFTDMSGYGSFFQTGHFYFDATSTQYNLGGTNTASNTVTIYGGIENGPTYISALTVQPTQTFSATIALGANISFVARNGDLNIASANIYGNSFNLDLNSGNNGAHTITLSGVLQDGGLNGGGLSLSISSVTAIFSGTNTYTGGTTISSGTLRLSGAGTTGSSSGAVTINGGTFDLNGDNVNTSRTIGALNGTGGTIANNNSPQAYFTTLNVGQGGASGSYAGSIVDHTAGGTGTIILNKVGAGTETLTGSSSYSFGTTISAGTLKLANTSGRALTGAGRISINNGGTLLMGADNQITPAAPITLGSTSGAGAAKIDAGGFKQGAGGNPLIPNSGTVGLGALTLNASSIIDMTATSVLHFGDSSGNTWTGTLSIYNWSGTPVTGGGAEQILFGGDSLGLSLTQLAQVQFYSGAGTGAFTMGAVILGDGEIVPIPEPSTWIIGILVVAALGWNQRRRIGGRASAS